MAKPRLLAGYDMIRARFDHAPRRLAYVPGASFEDWKASFKQKVLELIGPFPGTVPLRMEVVDEEIIDDFVEAGIDPYIQRKIVYDTEPFASCVARLLVPGDIKQGERRPAILCAHGHGSGKHQMIGLDHSTWQPKNGSAPGAPNFEAAAVHLVKLGYVVIAPDWRAFGERALDPEYARRGRDPCNVLHMSFG
ncbi:MAG: alpha/beta hydrolase family protein, partial [Candidatus Sigynarchaeum springense]